MPHSSIRRSDGFTAIPRHILDLLLCLPLTKRDLGILLLVVRLTYGCRNTEWAHLKQVDLATIGIGPTHARKCFQSLLSRKLLVQNGVWPECRLNTQYRSAHLEKDTEARLDRLAALVGYHLGASPAGNFSPVGRPEKVTPTLPKEKVYPYQNGNFEAAMGWSYSQSSRRFEKDFDAP